MRRFLIPLIMASVALPVAASAKERSLLDGFRERAAEARQEKSSEDRPARVERRSRPTFVGVRSTVTTHSGDSTHSSGGHGDYHREVRQDHRDFHASDPTRRDHREYHRDLKRDHRSVHRSWERDSRRGGHGEYHRDLKRDHDDLHAGNPTGREHRNWHRDASREHAGRHIAWDTSWRRNRSYDWLGYRSRYGSLYNLSPYYDPYGWGYRRFSIGFSLWPNYYRSSYWLNDPWQYRLPPAYGPYRWIRYYDDALLVNIYTGQVVDVLHNFFW